MRRVISLCRSGFSAALLFAGFLSLPAACAYGQTETGASTSAAADSTAAGSAANDAAHNPSDAPVPALMTRKPLEWGPFFNGGVGTSERSDYRFLSVGVQAGKVLTSAVGPGLLRGQFEYGAEVMPWWQGYAPPFNRYNVTSVSSSADAISGPYRTGGAYNGVSVTPILLRWNFIRYRRVLPFAQGGGGLIWTNHKFPPVGPVPAAGHGDTSVWNFTPQFGVGFQYFVRPKQSIRFGANAVHISSASLGDANPGVNASVQFQIGYTWWK